MKGQNRLTSLLLVILVVGIGIFTVTGIQGEGDQLNSLQANSENPNETTIENYIPFLSSIESCDFGKYDRCIEDTYEYEDARAVSILAYQSYSNPTTEESLKYQCVDTGVQSKTYLLDKAIDDINEPVNDWESLDADGEEISSEGEIPFTEINDGYSILCLNKADSGDYWAANGVSLSNDGFSLEEPTESPKVQTYRKTEITPTEDGMKATVYLENVGGDMQERNLVELQPREQELFSFVSEQSTCDPDKPQNVNKEFQLNSGEKVSITLESSGLEPGEYDAVMVSTDGCASQDPSVVSTEPFGWQTTVESDVVVEKDEPNVVEYREPDISTDFNEISTTVYLENTGGDMTEDYLVELNPQRTGSLSFLSGLSFVGEQSTCDSDNPKAVHKEFSLDSGERTSVSLTSTGLDEGSYDVVLTSADGCASEDPSVESVGPYGWQTSVTTVDVESPNKPPSIDSLTVPGEVEAGQDFPVTVSASDPDGDELSIEWGNGDTGDSTTYSFSDVGAETIQVTVSDGEETVSKTVAVNVVEPEEDAGFFEGLLEWFSNLFK